MSDKRGIPERCQHGSHGLRAMQGALKRVRNNGGDWLAELGDIGEVVRELRDELIRDLGGHENVSTAKKIVIEQVSKSWVMLQSIDEWLLTRPLVNKRKRTIFAVVEQRQKIEDSLIRNLRTLGLERRAATVSPHDWEPPSDAA